jgi:hypothetical protein
VPVDEDARAHVRRRIDERLEPVALRDLPREVVVHVEDRGTPIEQLREALAILVEGDVEHRHAVARAGIDLREQRDVALDTRDEDAVGGCRVAQLRQRTDAVRIPVEDVDDGHGSGLGCGSRVRGV